MCLSLCLVSCDFKGRNDRNLYVFDCTLCFGAGMCKIQIHGILQDYDVMFVKMEDHYWCH